MNNCHHKNIKHIYVQICKQEHEHNGLCYGEKFLCEECKINFEMVGYDKKLFTFISSCEYCKLNDKRMVGNCGLCKKTMCDTCFNICMSCSFNNQFFIKICKNCENNI